MQWELFAGGFFGAIVGGALGMIAIVVVDWIDQRRKSKQNWTLDDILEKDIERFIVEHWQSLFPSWQIYDTTPEEARLSDAYRPTGVQFKVIRGFIDILCINPSGELVVIELKKDKASDQVVSQIDRYINYIEKHIAQPNQRVKGIIIARYFDSQLAAIIEKRRNISIWTFEWFLKFNKRPIQQL